MKKIVILIIFVCVGITIQANEQVQGEWLSSKIIGNSKTRLNKESGTSWIVLHPKRIWKNHFQKGETPSRFVANVTADIGIKRIIDASFNHYLYIWPSIKLRFKFKDNLIVGNQVLYTVTDNHDSQVKKIFKVKRNSLEVSSNISQNSIENHRRIDSKVWNENGIINVIEQLYGVDSEILKHCSFKKNIVCPNSLITSNPKFERFFDDNKAYRYTVKEELDRCPPKGCHHDLSAPVNVMITLSKRFKSIAVISSSNAKALLAFFQMPSSYINYVESSFYLEKSGDIFVIAEDWKGKFYMSKPYKIFADLTTSNHEDVYTPVFFWL